MELRSIPGQGQVPQDEIPKTLGRGEKGPGCVKDPNPTMMTSVSDTAYIESRNYPFLGDNKLIMYIPIIVSFDLFLEGLGSLLPYLEIINASNSLAFISP